MVAAPYARELGRRHVAGDALVPRTVRPVPGVRRRVADSFGVAWQAGVVRLWPAEEITATRGMAIEAVELAGGQAGARQPKGVGEVLSQVAPVRVEVGMLERGEVVMVEVAITRHKCLRDRPHLGVARRAEVTDLLRGEVLVADDERAIGAGFFIAGSHVLAAGPVTRLAVDAGLYPDGVIGIGL